jgi:hypothetical protein
MAAASTGLSFSGNQASASAVDVALVHQLAADGLAGAAFEQYVVGHHHRTSSWSMRAVDLEYRLDVLDEVEQLVADGGPEVVALDDALTPTSAAPSARGP